MKMPWGKYKGQDVSDVPTSYICWILSESGNVKPDLLAAMQQQIIRRLKLRVKFCSNCGSTNSYDDYYCSGCFENDDEDETKNVIAKEIPERWLRKMAMRFHPDRGGSAEAMAAVNAGMELLKEFV